jgi:positive phototaxis protein PixI
MSAKLVSESHTNLAGELSLAEKDRQIQPQFLRFRLQPDLMAAIDIDRVIELVSIPLDRVVPMPHLPPAVMGVYNWRGEILWIVDFAKLLGLDPMPSAQCYRSLQPTIILSYDRAGEKIEVGLLVAGIEEIESCASQPIQSPTTSHLHQKISSWLKGYWQLTTGEELLILDEQAIFNCLYLHSNI